MAAVEVVSVALGASLARCIAERRAGPWVEDDGGRGLVAAGSTGVYHEVV